MITELFLPTKGGTASSFDDDFRRLGGKDIHIITAEVPDTKEFDREHPNSIHRLTLKRWLWLKPESLIIYIKLFQKSLWLTIRQRITTILAGRALPEGLIGLIVARLTGCLVLIYAHGEELTGWGRGKKFQTMCFVLRKADWILANSDDTRNTLIDLIGVESQRVILIYPTVDDERFSPDSTDNHLKKSIGIDGKKKLILSVGRLQRRKGFDNVIRSLPLLVKEGLDIEYALIGIGEDLAYLQELAKELDVANRLHFLGHVSYEDLPRWYNTCDLFAMPNRDINGDSEGFGLVFLEAAASGKPVISGKAGGTGSAVIDGQTGLRVDGENVQEIIHAASYLLRNPTQAKAMGDAARSRVLTNFTHKRRIKQIRELISKS